MELTLEIYVSTSTTTGPPEENEKLASTYGLIVSALDSGLAVRVRALAGVISLFLGKKLSFHSAVPFSTQEYNWVLANC